MACHQPLQSPPTGPFLELSGKGPPNLSPFFQCCQLLSEGQLIPAFKAPLTLPALFPISDNTCHAFFNSPQQGENIIHCFPEIKIELGVLYFTWQP